MNKNLILSDELREKITSMYVKIGGVEYFVSAPLRYRVAPDFGTNFQIGRDGLIRYEREGKFYTSKVSKLIKYLFSVDSPRDFYDVRYDFDYPNCFVEKLINAYIEKVTASIKPIEATIIESNDIASVYEKKDADGCGSLNTSCMRKGQVDNSTFIEFYDELRRIGVEVSILYTENEEGLLTSRALLWKNIKTTSGENITLIDRVYNENLLRAYEQYAQKNGCYMKTTQCAGVGNIKKNENVLKGDEYFIQLCDSFDSWIERAPYMDTFYQIGSIWSREENSHQWFLVCEYIKHCDYEFRETSGYRSDIDMYFCEVCGSRLEEGEVYHSDNGECYCSSCYYEIYTSCHHCGNEIDIENATWAEVRGEFYCHRCCNVHAA